MSNKKVYHFLTIFTALLITLLVSSCEQFKKSIKDTFKPEEEVEKAKKEASSAAEINSSNASNDTDRQVAKREEEDPSIFEKKKDPFQDSSYYEKAQRELLSLPQFQDKELFCYSSIHFYDDGRINVDLLDPNKPTYLDEYSYRKGKWEEPKPRQSVEEQQMLRGRFPLSKIDFRTLVGLCEKINQKVAQTQGAKELTHIYITYSSYDKQIEWRGSISGDRESFSIWADADGSNLRFD